MSIKKAEDALRLPRGELQIVRETPAGRICERYEFTAEEVVDAASQIIIDAHHGSVPLIEPPFQNQAEIIASCANAGGWNSASEAFAYDETVIKSSGATGR